MLPRVLRLLRAGDAMNGFAGLGLVKATLNRLARLPSTIARPVADALNVELQRQRAAGTDPYGRSHAPLKRPRRSGNGGPPLVDSGASYDATKARPLAGAGVSVTLGGSLPYHMKATRYRVVRAALPRGAMPPAWRAAIERALMDRGRL